jgi:cytoskeleton protein RodZ
MGEMAHTGDDDGYGSYAFPLGDELRGERATLGKSLLDVQRDLRIKAAYIAAIEDARPDVFPNPAFIPGYVRSYARYLSLDPDEVYGRFCHDTGFTSGAARRAKADGDNAPSKAAPVTAKGAFQPNFPLAAKRGNPFADLPLPAIGSLLVLVGLVGGLGYGGWTVLENIQRVEFAPVEEVPLAVSEVDALSEPQAAELEEPVLRELASPVAATALADLYRHQELEVAVLMPRDGPIASIDPERFGLLAGRSASGSAVVPDVTPASLVQQVSAESEAVEFIGPMPLAQDPDAADPAAPVVVVAERAAWMRVYLENGTVIFEGILDKGQTWSLPQGLGAPMIWAGNSGSVYVRVGEDLFGPLGSGTRAVRDVDLAPAAISERFAQVDQIPEVLSQVFGDGPVIMPASISIQ